MNLSKNLKKIRKEHHLSQEQFAEKLGVSRQSVSKWESNLAYPDLDRIIQISKVFNIQVDDLLNQNIQEVTKERQSKMAMNRVIDSILSYITKSIDLFSSMKFKTKLKCILEQVMIISILFCMFMILAAVGDYVVNGFIASFPTHVYNIIRRILESLYIIFAVFLGVTLVFHIFKIRYLDYYEIVTEEEETSKEEKREEESIKVEKNKKIFLERKKEKIIIRNPNGKDYKFIKGLFKIVIFIVKMMVAMVAFGIGLLLIGLVACFVCSFLIAKTGLFFIGIEFICIAAIAVTFFFLLILLNFIMNRKNNKKIILYSFLVSIFVLGIGSGLICISFTKFQYIDDIQDSVYKTHTVYLEMEDDLILDDYHWFDFKYIEEEREDIKIEFIHTDFVEVLLENQNSHISISTIAYERNFFDALRQQIKDFNHFRIVDYEKIQVNIYLSHENYECIQKNRKAYEEEKKQREELCVSRSNWIYEQQIQSLKEEIFNLKSENKHLESLLQENSNIKD